MYSEVGPKWNEVAACEVSELSEMGSRTWGGIPGEDDVGSSDTLWQRPPGHQESWR